MDSDLNFTQDFLNLIRDIRKPESIKELLEDSLLYQAADKSGVTLLHYSAQYTNVNLTKYLLKKGCQVDIQDSKGNAPLMIAAEKNGGVVLKMLLLAGADIFKLNNDNKSALHTLSQQFPMGIHTVRLFLRHLDEKCSTSEEVAKKLHDARCPLYHAVLLEDFKVIECMIERGSSVNYAHPVRKYTAVHVAVGNEDLLSLMVLLKHGADVNALDYMNRSPIDKLYVNNKEHSCTKIEILNILMKQGAVMTSCTSEGIFQVYCILINGNHKAIRVLIKSGLDFNAKDTGSKKTVLRYLAKNLEPNVVEELKLKTGEFDVDVRDKFGQTPLLFAAFNGNVSMVKFLLKQGAKTDLKHNTDGTTPLYHVYECVKEGFEERFRQCGGLLLHHDADPQLKVRIENNEKVTILDAALKVGNIDRIKPVVAHLAMLEKRGTHIRTRIREKINSHDKLKAYFKKCRRLLKKKISERVVLFDLLSSNRKMAQYLNNENIAYKLCTETMHYMWSTMQDHYYFSVLNKRCCEGKNFKKLKTIAARIICKIFENRIDKQHLIIDKVTGYLNDRSLRNLCQLYHQLGSHRQRTVKSSKNKLVAEIRQKKRSRKKRKKRKVSNESYKKLVRT